MLNSLHSAKRGLLARLSSCAALLIAAAAASAAGDDTSVRVGTSGDAPLAPWRAELLDVAFEAASAMPAQPHVKDRSRAQEVVVDACLQLDQAQRAAGWAGQIDNWRQGTALADAAHWFAQHGRADEARHAIELATKAADAPGDEDSQAWQRDRIVAAIARAQAALDSPAAPAGQTPEPPPGKDAVDAQLAALDPIVRAGNMDAVRGALEDCTRLCERCYADPALRAQVEAKIEGSWTSLPLPIRVDLLSSLFDAALAHDDSATALHLAQQAEAVVASADWLPEDHVPLLARLAVMRFRAGDAEGARRKADAALALYKGQRDVITDIFRADALRPLAEAWAAMGDADKARSLYALAIEEGALNPNSRPRAEDLVASSCSLAVQDVQPDDALLARIREIERALAPPW